MKKLLLVLLVGICMSVDARKFESFNTPLIPRDVLFGMNDSSSISAMRISPNGNRLVFSKPVNTVFNLFVCDKGEDGNFDLETARQVTFDKEQHIGGSSWMHNNTHLLYKQDSHGNENHHLYLLNVETLETIDLTPFEEVKVTGFATDKKWPNKVLVGMNLDNPQLFDFYTMDITQKHEWTKITNNPGDVLFHILDDEWNIRGRGKMTAEGGRLLELRASEEENFKEFINWSMEDAEISGFVGFTKNPEEVYVIDANDSNTGKFKKVNFKTGATEVLAFDPNYELGGVMIHPDTKEVMMYHFEKDRIEPVILNENFKEDYEQVNSLEDGDLTIVSMDEDMNTWICAFQYDNKISNYYLYDRVEKECRFLCKRSEKFDPYTLVEMKPISFQARDGLTINGYLSLPYGQTENIPMVLNVHGGPWARDNWCLHPEVQWLCNRGYAVLQLNYRGSTGFGKAFVDASNKEWGRAMHNDLIDGVNWAIDKGIADPEKVAIYGGSYGGYAALCGAAFTPDVFCCAVDIVGISNILTHLAAYPPYWKPLLARTKKRVGDPETEEAMLKERSPLFSAHKIKKPLLIAQGAHDPRVKQAEAEQIVNALKENGCEYEYMLFPDEGHGFSKHHNRLKFYAKAEEFLAKYLGGRVE